MKRMEHVRDIGPWIFEIQEKVDEAFGISKEGVSGWKDEKCFMQ